MRQTLPRHLNYYALFHSTPYVHVHVDSIPSHVLHTTVQSAVT